VLSSSYVPSDALAVLLGAALALPMRGYVAAPSTHGSTWRSFSGSGPDQAQ
jgi:hypothetical protein